MRGGISYIVNNNKYMKNHHDGRPSKYVMYLDANNLYGWAMSKCLPTGGFKRMSQKKKVQDINLATHTNDIKKGLILDVDLEHPSSLHKLHNDYPLAAEKIKVNKNMLSPYCENIRQKYGNTIGQIQKIISTLGNKEK